MRCLLQEIQQERSGTRELPLAGPGSACLLCQLTEAAWFGSSSHPCRRTARSSLELGPLLGLTRDFACGSWASDRSLLNVAVEQGLYIEPFLHEAVLFKNKQSWP